MSPPALGTRFKRSPHSRRGRDLSSLNSVQCPRHLFSMRQCIIRSRRICEGNLRLVENSRPDFNRMSRAPNLPPCTLTTAARLTIAFRRIRTYWFGSTSRSISARDFSSRNRSVPIWAYAKWSADSIHSIRSAATTRIPWRSLIANCCMCPGLCGDLLSVVASVCSMSRSNSLSRRWCDR